MHNRKKLLKRT